MMLEWQWSLRSHGPVTSDGGRMGLEEWGWALGAGGRELEGH